MITGLLFLCIFTLGFSMIAKRLENTVVTAPMLFIGFGFAIAEMRIMPLEQSEELLHIVAEVSLVLLLFIDAAKTNLKAVLMQYNWPLRMLAIGLPLSVFIGTLTAWPLLNGWPLVAIVLVAAILTPTDAALGQVVVENTRVPERARRTLILESGLNDGLALPIILLFASLTAETMAAEQMNWFVFIAGQLILGPLAGGVVGVIGGRVFLYANDRKLTTETFEGIGAIALAGVAYLGALQIGGNGFVAAFVAGLCFGSQVQGRCRFLFEFTESEGQILTWGAFFLIGLVLLPDALAGLTWPYFGVILLSLFVVRPLAIWISLIGTDARPRTRLFFGWFGPRGLATALFALVVVSTISHEFAEPVLTIAVNAVWISALLHGLSAVPGANWYANSA